MKEFFWVVLSVVAIVVLAVCANPQFTSMVLTRVIDTNKPCTEALFTFENGAQTLGCIEEACHRLSSDVVKMERVILKESDPEAAEALRRAMCHGLSDVLKVDRVTLKESDPEAAAEKVVN